MSSCTWGTAVLLHRTALAQSHPINKVLYGVADADDAGDAGDAGADRERAAREAEAAGEEVVDDLNDNSDEPLCRICQMRQSEAPEMRMIRPCLCSGSVSYVHTDCLNRWRSMSTAAYFTCSICRYNYRIERTLVAQLLMQESFAVALAAILILTLCFAVGGILSGTISYLQIPFDPVLWLLQLMEVDKFWLRCNRPLPIGTLLHSLYTNSTGFNDLVKSMLGFVRSPLPMMYIMCNATVSCIANVFLLGAMVVGSAGFSGLLLGHVFNAQEGGQMMIQGGMFVTWLMCLGSRALTRLSLVVGCLLATQEVYKRLIVHARQLSHWLGDRIMEPNR